MNSRQRWADRDMVYLAKAWNHGYTGPSKHARGSSMWQQLVQQSVNPTYVFNEERVDELHKRYLRVGRRDRFFAAVLVLVYREGYSADGYPFTKRQLLDALDMFSLS